MSSTRVLVTGATGRVGTAVVETLLDRESKVTVRAAARDEASVTDRFGTEGSLPETLEAVEFDFEKPETWGAALDGIDHLFLMFPPKVGVDPVRQCVDAAVRVGVERVALLSVLGAEKLPFLPHRRIERHLADSGVETAFLRAAYFMQNLTDIHGPELVERDELFVPAGDGTLGFVDARDVGAVAGRVLADELQATVGGTAYDLTGPASLTFHEAAAVFSNVLDRQISYPNPDRLAFARRLRARGVDIGMVLFMLAEYEVPRRGYSGRTTDELGQLLERDPTTLERFVAEHREQFSPD